jgi:hypothetical protein
VRPEGRFFLYITEIDSSQTTHQFRGFTLTSLARSARLWARITTTRCRPWSFMNRFCNASPGSCWARAALLNGNICRCATVLWVILQLSSRKKSSCRVSGILICPVGNDVVLCEATAG